MKQISNRLIAAARRSPEKLSPETLAKLNSHLQQIGAETIRLPSRPVFGRSLTLPEIAAMRTGQPLPPPARPAMTVAEFQQQQLERARELAAKRKAAEQPKVAASFLTM